MELGAFIAQGAAAGPTDHALACLLGLLGLRVGEACAVDIESLDASRGHRTVTVLGKGHKLAVMPLPPRVSRAIDQAANERDHGPLLLMRSGRRMDRHGPPRIVPPPPKRGGIPKHTPPPPRPHTFIPPPLAAGAPLRDVQIAARHADPRTTTR